MRAVILQGNGSGYLAELMGADPSYEPVRGSPEVGPWNIIREERANPRMGGRGQIDVLLTVPHSQCSPEGLFHSHPCDTAAKETAFKVRHFLQHIQQGINVKMMPGSVPRAECDLNREECRKTPWRKKVRELMGESLIFLDMHSFYDSESKFGDVDVAVFFHGGRDTRLRLKILSNMLRKAGLRVNEWESDLGTDDLLKEWEGQKWRGASLPGTLIELNESVPNERRTKVAEVMAFWVSDQLAELGGTF